MRPMIIAVLLVFLSASPAAAAPKALSGTESRYPHAIRLEHGRYKGDILVSVNWWRATEIYRSNRQGRSFKQIAKFTDDIAANTFMCCAHLFELPKQVGTLPAGTVLWAGSIGTKEAGMGIRVWQSPDGGRSWSYLSTCASAPGGIWEPEFTVDSVGRLVCHFADETFRGHSQVLARTYSTDGVNWSAKSLTVAVSPGGYRPGMAHVRRLPNGSYFMTYEICGQRSQYFCEAYYRTSGDGWNYGDPGFYGTVLHSREGRYFTHTPSITWAPNGTPNGRLVLTGQMLMHSSGKIDAANGARLFINENGGAGEWYEAPAPISVPQARDLNCPNYHPALLASPDGESVLEFTSDFDATGACITHYASAPLPPFPG